MTEQTSDASPQRRSWLMVLPLIVFLLLADLFWLRLGDGDPSRIPSALIGRPAPHASHVQLLIDRSASAGALLERSGKVCVASGGAGDPP